MQTISQTTTGAQTLKFIVPGKYFVLMATTNGVNVRFYKNGKKLDLGEITNVLPGLECVLGELNDLEPAFHEVQIDVLAADTITFGIGNGQVRYNRSQGNVAITNNSGPVTQQTKTVTTTESILVAQNASRRYLFVQNKDTTGNIFLRFNNTGTVTDGVKIGPGASFVCDSFCPTQDLHAISDIASNPNVIVIYG